MINSGKEWDWMDDRIHKSIDESLVEDLKGWGFDTDALEREGAFAPQSTKSPRANWECPSGNGGVFFVQ